MRDAYKQQKALPDEPDDFDDLDDFDMPEPPQPSEPEKNVSQGSDSLDDIATLEELADFDIPYYQDIPEEPDIDNDDDDDEDDDDYDYDYSEEEDEEEEYSGSSFSFSRHETAQEPEEEIVPSLSDHIQEQEDSEEPEQPERIYFPEELDELDEMYYMDSDDESNAEAYETWYEDFQDAMRVFDKDELFDSLNTLLHQSKNVFSLNRKLMKKTIDVSWVEAIENGLIHVDNFLRNPRRTIEDVEEIVPIALSRKITVESIKHLAQHTDLIQSYDKKSGKITPSKILNVHKEESLMTYENKFVNTLIDRLYLFINIRYQKLAKVAKDEQAYVLGYHTDIDDEKGGKLKIEVKMETISSLETQNENGYTVWQRVEKLKKVIEGYKGSELCTKLGNAYIRPPVMRTNAIMKNVDLKACLTLWQYIESYDQSGYEINIEDNTIKPENNYIEDFYRVILMNLLLFRSGMEGQDSLIRLKSLKKKKHRTIKPKFIRHFENTLSDDYSVTVSGAPGYIASDGDLKITAGLPNDADTTKIFSQISQVISIEKAYQEQLEQERKIKEKEAQMEAYRQAEQERIDKLRQKELDRLQKQQEEEQQKLEEMLARKRAEQEAADRERERQEQERLAILEAKRKEEEERQKREEEERIRREEQERIDAERQRLEDEKNLIRSELGEAEGVDTETLSESEEVPEEITVTEEEIEEAKASMNEEISEFEDPKEVAVRMKLEQQKREKERIESERAARLKAEREYFQNKPFSEIHREYSKNPFYAIPRLIQWLLVVLFHLIPEDTDNPDWKRQLAEIKEKQRLALLEQEEKEKMEVYYRKYAQTFKYRFRRSIDDYKFRKKREKERKGKPRPAYTPPKRTREEELHIQKQMKRLYREYHVGIFERIHRSWKEFQRNRRNLS